MYKLLVASSLEATRSLYIRQPQGVPEETGFWAIQVPPPGTGSAHRQYPGVPYRKKSKAGEPVTPAARKLGAATERD
eukprot:10352961-Heterocapsa_arctica.AAC.1